MSAATGANIMLKDSDHVVVVGASLAGLRAAEALRKEGYAGHLTMVGDEPHLPYDRPPLSKQVIAGRMAAENTILPRFVELDAEWRLGVAATGLDRKNGRVELADGERIPYDRVLISTGIRARPWHVPEENDLDGVFAPRTLEDAKELRKSLAAGPRRVLVVGGGFTGCEIASICRELGLPVTLVERSGLPLDNALGATVGTAAAELQRDHGVDLRCDVSLESLEGDGQGRVRQAHLSDGDTLEVDVAVVTLGGIRNVEWLKGSGLMADGRGIACDATLRAFTNDAIVTDDVYVAGDVARWPHPVYENQLLSVEHWGTAVEQGATAAHNMICNPSERRPYDRLPEFWSNQFGVNIKSVGVPSFADEVVVPQGSLENHRGVVAYGRSGRIVAAVAFNEPRELTFYEALIEQAEPFPPDLDAGDEPVEEPNPVPARFPSTGSATHEPTAEVTGPLPADPRDALGVSDAAT